MHPVDLSTPRSLALANPDRDRQDLGQHSEARRDTTVANANSVEGVRAQSQWASRRRARHQNSEPP